MQFSEIRSGLEGIVFDTVRIDSGNYFEAVVVKDELPKLTASLEKIFGPPAWPSKGPLLPAVQGIIKDFGGIRLEQTLYFQNDKEDTLFAMLWPWQDDYHTTVKMGGNTSKDRKKVDS